MSDETELAQALREVRDALASASAQLEQSTQERDRELQRLRNEVSELRHRRNQLQQWLQERKVSLRAVEERIRVLEPVGPWPSSGDPG